MRINVDQCWSLLDQRCRSMPIKPPLIQQWPALISIDQHWSLLSQIDLYWSKLIGTDLYWDQFLKFDLYWSALNGIWDWSSMSCNLQNWARVASQMQFSSLRGFLGQQGVSFHCWMVVRNYFFGSRFLQVLSLFLGFSLECSPSRRGDLFRPTWPKGLTHAFWFWGHMKVRNPFLTKIWWSEPSVRSCSKPHQPIHVLCSFWQTVPTTRF